LGDDEWAANGSQGDFRDRDARTSVPMAWVRCGGPERSSADRRSPRRAVSRRSVGLTGVGPSMRRCDLESCRPWAPNLAGVRFEDSGWSQASDGRWRISSAFHAVRSLAPPGGTSTGAPAGRDPVRPRAGLCAKDRGCREGWLVHKGYGVVGVRGHRVSRAFFFFFSEPHVQDVKPPSSGV